MICVSCDISAQSVRGNGNIIKQTREASGFSGVSVGGVYNVYLTQGSTESVIVEADENLLPYIETEVRGNTLEIRTRKNTNIKDHKEMNIYVSLKDFDHIHSGGASNVYAETELSGGTVELHSGGASDMKLGVVQANSFEGRISGSSDITLSGNTQDADIRVSGSGDFKGANFKAEDVTVRVSGSGDADIHASESVDASASGSGDIKVHGRPSRKNYNTSGSGDISFM